MLVFRRKRHTQFNFRECSVRWLRNKALTVFWCLLSNETGWLRSFGEYVIVAYFSCSAGIGMEEQEYYENSERTCVSHSRGKPLYELFQKRSHECCLRYILQYSFCSLLAVRTRSVITRFQKYTRLLAIWHSPSTQAISLSAHNAASSHNWP
jgi:hypothetical protein